MKWWRVGKDVWLHRPNPKLCILITSRETQVIRDIKQGDKYKVNRGKKRQSVLLADLKDLEGHFTTIS